MERLRQRYHGQDSISDFFGGACHGYHSLGCELGQKYAGYPGREFLPAGLILTAISSYLKVRRAAPPAES